MTTFDGGWRLDGRWWIAPDGTRLRAICGGTGGGSTKTTVTTLVPPKSAEELELIRKQNAVLDIQVSELKRQNEALTEIFPKQKQLLAAQTQAAISAAEFQKIQIEQFKEFAPRQAELATKQAEVALRQAGLQEQLVTKALAELEGTPAEQEIRKLSNERALAILRGEAPPLLPGQQERINTIFGRAAEEAQAGLRTFGEELAASRGLRVTDTPIGGELLRQGRELASSLSASKAVAELNVGQAEQQFGEAVRQFQENLRQRAFENRLALTGNVSGATGRLPIGTGTGLPVMNPVFAGTSTGAALTGSGNLLDALARDRLGQAGQTTRAPGADQTGTYVGAGAQLAGSAATLAAMYYLAPVLAGSSARLKTAILPYDKDEYERALEKIRATPITRWKYKWEPEGKPPHTGPILELAPEDIREDELRIDLLSYAGLLHAGLKAVDRNVERLSTALAAAVKEAA